MAKRKRKTKKQLELETRKVIEDAKWAPFEAMTEMATDGIHEVLGEVELFFPKEEFQEDRVFSSRHTQATFDSLLDVLCDHILEHGGADPEDLTERVYDRIALLLEVKQCAGQC